MARARLCARDSRILADALVVLFDCELTLGGSLTKSTDENRDITSTENLVHADLLKHEQPELSLPGRPMGKRP